METTEDIGSKVLAVIGEYLGEAVTPETVLADKGADSMDVREIAMNIEDEFDISISDEQLESVQTAQDLIALVAAAKP